MGLSAAPHYRKWDHHKGMSSFPLTSVLRQSCWAHSSGSSSKASALHETSPLKLNGAHCPPPVTFWQADTEPWACRVPAWGGLSLVKLPTIPFREPPRRYNRHLSTHLLEHSMALFCASPATDILSLGLSLSNMALTEPLFRHGLRFLVGVVLAVRW